jgi:D-alanyl-D-alanine carboxypeptidase
MLEEDYVKGIKTGYTEDAGECLISLFEYDNGED